MASGTTNKRANGSGEPCEAGAGEAARTAALLRAQDELLEMIAEGASREEFLEGITSNLARLLCPALSVVQFGGTDGRLICQKPPRALPDEVLQSMAQAAACEAKEGTVVAPIDGDDRCAALQQAAEAKGLCCLWIKPILDQDGKNAGSVALFYDRPHEPESAEHQAVDAIISLARCAVRLDSRDRSQKRAVDRVTSLAKTIPGVVYQRIVTPDGDIRYTYISEGARDLFGVAPEEIVADPQALFDCHGPIYREDFRERLLEASRNLTMWDVEAQIISRDGEEKWTHAIAKPRRQPDGSVLWDGVILDATRKKMAEMELRQAKEEADMAHKAQSDLLDMLRTADERFAALAASIPGVVYQRRVTPEGDIRYTYISEGARDLFGVSPEEILTNPQALFDCHGPEYRETFRERLLEASRNLTMWDVEAQIITRDGEEKWTHAIARPHKEPDGSVLWDGIILDGTWIKKAELDLRKMKEVAESSSRAKTEFLAQISHELRTPLNAIIGFSEILRAPDMGRLGREKCAEYADDINLSGVELLKTINDILEFTRMETGEYDFHEDDVAVDRTIDSALRQVAPLAESANICLHKDYAGELPTVLGDSAKLRRIFTILLSNAIKFSEAGGEVRIGSDRDAEGNLVISVADSGIGIAREDMPKVFEAFGQVDSKLSRRYEGLGLGVPLALNLAALHEGSIEFDSDVGVGTTARLILPKHRVTSELADALSA